MCVIAWSEQREASLTVASDLLLAFPTQFTGISKRCGHIQTTKMIKGTWLTGELGTGRLELC